MDSDEQEEPTSYFPVPLFQPVYFPAPLPVTVALFRVEEIPWTSRRNRQAARFAAQAQEVRRTLAEGHVVQGVL